MLTHIQEHAALAMQASPLMLPLIVGLLVVTLHWVRVLRILFGLMVASGVVNTVLKAIVRSRRPDGATNCMAVPCISNKEACKATSFGMPSGHAQLAAAVATFLLLASFSRKRCPPPIMDVVRAFGVLLCVLLLLFVPLSRTAWGQQHALGPVGMTSPHGCHTYAQVTVGALIGVALGVAAWHGWGASAVDADDNGREDCCS